MNFNTTSALDFSCAKHVHDVGTRASHSYDIPSNMPKVSSALPHQPMQVVLPNVRLMCSEKNILLPESKELTASTRVSRTFTKLTEGSFVSTCQYCDHGYAEKFTRDHVGIAYQDKQILRGHRNHHNKLWYFDLSKKDEEATPCDKAASFLTA